MAMYLGSNKVELGQSGGGSSDFSTAQVTFDNSAGAQFLLPITYNDGAEANSAPLVEGVSGIQTAILYKGMAVGLILDEGVTVTTTGDAEYDDGALLITGDCTITIS